MALKPSPRTSILSSKLPFVQELRVEFTLDLQIDVDFLLNFGSFVDNRIDFSRKTL